MSATELEVAGRRIGPAHPLFLIAEAGVNHNGKLDLALALVDAAVRAGADAVKFQLFRLEEQVAAAAPTARYQEERTGQATMRDMAHGYDLPWEAHRAIAAHCAECGIHYLASCFEPTAVDLLRELGGPCIKIGSGEITNVLLLDHAARSGLPVLLSTGMSTMEDVTDAVDVLRGAGCKDLLLLHCVSSYPADVKTMNLRAIQTLQQVFGVPVGLSDHTRGTGAAIAALALGACLVEKHLTLDRNMEGPDHAMSMAPGEMAVFIRDLRELQAGLGDGVKRLLEEERATQSVARRGLVALRDLPAGERLSRENTAFKRPAVGVDPRHWARVEGRALRVAVAADAPITLEMLE
ncbi:MAG: N-acetylneuraminate synthase family protein [Kiritimatiellae bacterium]|nr:N-acetylneuraminate synthase family protein [Kiritimatiellia bacterium]